MSAKESACVIMSFLAGAGSPGATGGKLSHRMAGARNKSWAVIECERAPTFASSSANYRSRRQNRSLSPWQYAGNNALTARAADINNMLGGAPKHHVCRASSRRINGCVAGFWRKNVMGKIASISVAGAARSACFGRNAAAASRKSRCQAARLEKSPASSGMRPIEMPLLPSRVAAITKIASTSCEKSKVWLGYHDRSA